MLAHQPLHPLAIDCLAEIPTGQGGDGIIGMARALGLAVTAEGVETQQQLERLRDLGCTNVQGYLFARPGSAAVIEPLLDLQVCAPDGPAATVTAV